MFKSVLMSLDFQIAYEVDIWMLTLIMNTLYESHSISTFVNVTLIAMIMGPANTTEFVEVRFSS